MALSYEEKWESGEGSSGQTADDERVFLVTGDDADNADDPATVQTWADANLPASFNGKSRSRNKRAYLAKNMWVFTCSYDNSYADTGKKAFSFNTAGGTQHISHARQHIATYGAVEGGETTTYTTPMDGFINVGKDNTVEGVDADISVFDFQMTLYLPPDQMTSAYVALLYHLTNTVNATSFTADVEGELYTFSEGEVRFKGAQGSMRLGEDWELTLNFSAIPNLTDFSIGDLSGMDKKGWQYLWERWELTQDDDHEFVCPKLVNVFIDEIYAEDNWTGLVPI